MNVPQQTLEASALAHQFDDLDQQRHAGELGMWLFLATEVMFFGGLFLAYSLYRTRDEAAFAAASHELDLFWGSLNTAVLLGSSLTIALAQNAAETARKRQLVFLLAATFVLGSVFLGIKGLEYYHKYEHHLMPIFGLPFEWHGSPAGATNAQMFFRLYFLMTGLHALHMVIGLGVILLLLVQAARGGLLGTAAAPIHISGLYWHFVDIVWVFLFPFLYLIGGR